MNPGLSSDKPTELTQFYHNDQGAGICKDGSQQPIDNQPTWSVCGIGRDAFAGDVALLAGVAGHSTNDGSAIFRQTFAGSRVLQRRLPLVGSQGPPGAEVISEMWRS